jgi:hypothetical protein
MTNLQKKLLAACRELELSIIVPCHIQLPKGGYVEALALLPDLGAGKGMVIVSDYKIIELYREELVSSGFGFSILSEPSTDQYDIESIIKMFQDWSWSNQSRLEPRWM